MKRALMLVLLVMAAVAAPVGAPAETMEAPVVVALIDSGINPYSAAFRDDSALAQLPPSRYLPDYPADCPAVPEEPTTACAVRLDLSLPALDAPTNPRTAYLDAYEADRALWESVQARQLYYVPGTAIVGAVSFGAGSQRCPARVGRSGVGYVEMTAPPPGGALNANSKCPERRILDDHGHGTMTSSRATGTPSSLAPGARVVMVEGLGAASSEWAARQPWIDVQSNSWGSLVPAPVDAGTMRVFAEAARKQFVVVASGNGLGFSGLAPTPTQLDGLGAPGVILVGGHDNGRVTAWHGQPAHVVADAYAGFAAIHDSIEPMRPDIVACCTSTSAPYAAGGAAAILREARRLLGDTRTGVRQGEIDGRPAVIAAQGTPVAGSAVLADGALTLDEWKRVYLLTAEALPAEGAHDGLLHWAGDPGRPPRHLATVDPSGGGPILETYGTADNPYCQACWTLPIRWTDVPAGLPAYANVGYGAINERSVGRAAAVLGGGAALPARPDEDAFFTQEEQVRAALFDPFTG